MKNQRLLFQQKAPWDWVADRVGMPDVSPWKPDKHEGGPECNKAATWNPQNLLMIWVDLWLNALSLANLCVLVSSIMRVTCLTSEVGEHRWHYGRKNYSHHTSHTFQYKWGAKMLFTYATSHPQFSWIYLKLGGSVPIGILAVAWESSTTAVRAGPSVTTARQCEGETFPLTGCWCWVCTSAECRLMSMGLLWFHPALLLRLQFPSFPEQQGRSRLELQRFPHTHTQTNTFFFFKFPCPASSTNHDSNPQSIRRVFLLWPAGLAFLSLSEWLC